MSLRTSCPRPLQASVAGIGLSLSVHSLLISNGSVLGVSGLIHSAVRGDTEAAIGALGMILGGALTGYLEQSGPFICSASHLRTILAGLLVGAGSKLAKGCTSGHMICGLSRFSYRSFIATVSFFLPAVAVTQLLHRENLPLVENPDWSLGGRAAHIRVVIAVLAPLLAVAIVSRSPVHNNLAKFSLRAISCLVTSLTFGISLSLGNMTDPNRVIAFLAMPVSQIFDPTLVWLAGSALPLSTFLYRYARPDHPRFGGQWNVPANTQIDARLICGSILFGVGWGICGICPGPALVNFGRALYAGENVTLSASWVLSMILGGFLVG